MDFLRFQPKWWPFFFSFFHFLCFFFSMCLILSFSSFSSLLRLIIALKWVLVAALLQGYPHSLPPSSNPSTSLFPSIWYSSILSLFHLLSPFHYLSRSLSLSLSLVHHQVGDLTEPKDNNSYFGVLCLCTIWSGRYRRSAELLLPRNAPLTNFFFLPHPQTFSLSLLSETLSHSLSLSLLRTLMCSVKLFFCSNGYT